MSPAGGERRQAAGGLIGRGGRRFLKGGGGPLRRAGLQNRFTSSRVPKTRLERRRRSAIGGCCEGNPSERQFTRDTRRNYGGRQNRPMTFPADTMSAGMSLPSSGPREPRRFKCAAFPAVC
jgi:hypothetical protein